MLTVLSPAKTFSSAGAPEGLPTTAPALSQESEVLLAHCRKLNLARIRELMRVSDPLARTAFRRFRKMNLAEPPGSAMSAALAYGGDVFRTLDPASLSTEDLVWAQDRFRVLSGFYGVLRPLDLIQPYRLEMRTPLETPRGRSLYEFWGDRIADALADAAGRTRSGTLLNLTSVEFIRTLKPAARRLRVVTARFEELRDGKPTTIGLFVKRARGLMARFIIEHRIETPEELREFGAEGYRFQPGRSDPDFLVFLRPKEWAA
ncbi:MAG: peroxide stress protein YaaA [Gammaproteobacteria bacterium]|nr:peroxide stress protein YaaA [Gammaproteobacteria bacterium]